MKLVEVFIGTVFIGVEKIPDALWVDTVVRHGVCVVGCEREAVQLRCSWDSVRGDEGNGCSTAVWLLHRR